MFTSNGSNDIILFSVCFSTTSRVFIIQQIYREKYFYDEHHKLIKERILFRTSKFDFLAPSPQKNTILFFFILYYCFLFMVLVVPHHVLWPIIWGGTRYFYLFKMVIGTIYLLIEKKVLYKIFMKND